MKCYFGIKFTSWSQQRNFRNLHKIGDLFDEGYGSDRELVPLCGVEYLEYTQYFDE